MSDRFRQFLADYPAFVLFATILSATLPTLFEPTLSWWTAWMFPLGTILLLSPFLRRGAILTVITTALLAWGSLWFSSQYDSNHYIQHVPSPACGATVELTVKDPLIPMGTRNWLPLPVLIRSELSTLRFTPEMTFQNVSGEVMLRMPSWIRDTALLDTITFGTRLTIQGRFEVPPPPLFEGSFDFQSWLCNAQTPMMFTADTLYLTPMTNDFQSSAIYMMGKLLLLRDLTLKRVTNGLSTEVKQMTAALLFGCKQGIGQLNKKDFIRAGTIHIFSVSGLHVGILAVILLWLLKPFPLKTRGMLLVILLFLYILTTGIQVSAFRSWVMIFLFTLTHISLRRTHPLNTLALAACVLLLIRPIWIFDIGFQYSFVVTAFLILTWQSILHWTSCITEAVNWIPVRYQKQNGYFRLRSLQKGVQSLLSCTVALGASAPLMSIYNGFFLPVSIFLNVVILPLTGVIMLALVVKIIMPFRFVGGCLNGVVEAGFGIMTGLCRTASATYGDWGLFGELPLVGVLMVWILLIFFFTTRNHWVSLGSAVTLIFGLVFIPMFHGYSAAESHLKVISGGDTVPPVLILSDMENRRITLVNTGAYGTLSGLGGWLHKRGFTTVDAVILTAGNASVYGGLSGLSNEISISKVIIPSKVSSRSKLWQVIPQLESRGTRILSMTADSPISTYHDPFFNIVNTPIQCEMTFQNGNPFRQVKLNTPKDKPAALSITRINGDTALYLIPFNSVRSLQIIHTSNP